VVGQELPQGVQCGVQLGFHHRFGDAQIGGDAVRRPAQVLGRRIISRSNGCNRFKASLTSADRRGVVRAPPSPLRSRRQRGFQREVIGAGLSDRPSDT